MMRLHPRAVSTAALTLLLLVLAAWTTAPAPAFAQDFDADATVDAADADDDNDGLADTVDPFALDKANGLATPIPFSLPFDTPGGGLLGLGFTGLMSNGTADYASLFDPAAVSLGGGAVTVNGIDDGDAYRFFNTQRNAFQVGVSARPTDAPFTVHTRIVAPFRGITPQNYQSMGFFIGTGDQDNYVKVTTAHIEVPGIEVLREVGGEPTSGVFPFALPGPDFVDLYAVVDPRTATMQPSFTATTGGTTTERTNAGPVVSMPAEWFAAPDRGLAIGILSTSFAAAPPFSASWDILEATADGAPTGQAAPPVVDLIPIERDKAARVSKLRLASTRFSAVSRRGRRAGTTVRLTLTGKATVELLVYRRTSGRTVRGRCVKTTRSNRRARTCTREIRVRGSVRRSLPFGNHNVRFTGTLAGRRLSPGQYRLVAVATDGRTRTRTRGPLFRVTR